MTFINGCNTCNLYCALTAFGDIFDMKGVYVVIKYTNPVMMYKKCTQSNIL